MDETWKEVKGYENLYMVSNLGRIKSLARLTRKKNGSYYPVKEKILKPITTTRGYKVVALPTGNGQRQFFVHRLVAIAFIPNPHNYPFINHKDENKSNNHVENIEWCTAKYNINYGNCRNKISESEIVSVNAYTTSGDFIGYFKSLTEAANELNVFIQNISKCCQKKIGYTRGIVFRYANDTEGNKKENIISANRYLKTAAHKAKRVIQYTLDGKAIKTYNSISEAAKQNGLSAGNIWSCCNKKYKSTGGYRWAYK